MAIKNDHYTYRVTWSSDDDVIKDMTRNKEKIPEPIAIKNYSEKFMVRIPPDVHRALAIKAAEAGVSLNRLASSKLSY
ncbi:MAG: type II toxin-antitoxin system HicB family antitoxin [Desulfobacterales bacterium]|nr:type II toxin-antitoxin system HicB family antitoxin [Desulfobacterales bacterium]